MRRSACIAMAVFLLVLSVVLFTTPAHPGDSDPLVWSIGRIWLGDPPFINGQSHMCTGFIVASRETPSHFDEHDGSPSYRNLVVTAGHCDAAQMTFVAHAVKIDGQWLPEYTDAVAMTGLSRSFDVMVGTFYSPWALPALIMDTGEIKHGEPLEVIGYGHYVLGRKVFPFDAYNTPFLEVTGTIIAGYSGSPVVRAGTNRVVGIAVQQHVQTRNDLFACFFGLPCKVTPPYYAVPIKRVADLVDLSSWTVPQ